MPPTWRHVLIATAVGGVTLVGLTLVVGASRSTAASGAVAPTASPTTEPTSPPWFDVQDTPTPAASTTSVPTPSMPTLAAPVDPSTITVAGARAFGWAFLDISTGQVSGSANIATMTNTMESMIKPWIAADYLRRLPAAGKQPTASALKELTLMIVDSNDDLAEKYYELDGDDAVVTRLISTCGLTAVTIRSYWWSYTTMTPRDAVRYGACLNDGRAAGPRWTQWILDTMKQVRGGVADQVSDEVQGGRWGIIDALPAELAAQTSIKNGWTDHDDGWHVNCLAVNAQWTLAVLLRVATLQQGATDCASVAAQLLVKA
jgi:hypothetical protein